MPAADDFFHTYMGEDPVILTRDGEGRLHALLNMCRHRGNRVVRCDDGNAKRFMCTYHGWTYRNDGALEYVPGEAQAYYDALDKAVPQSHETCVQTYAGIVFATWAADAPSLDAYLGDARWYLETVFNRRDGGMQALGPMKWLEPRQLEDASRQLLRQLPRPDQPSLQRPGPDPLSRPPASVARGPVREPQQARLRQRALDHLPRRGRQPADLILHHIGLQDWLLVGLAGLTEGLPHTGTHRSSPESSARATRGLAPQRPVLTNGLLFL